MTRATATGQLEEVRLIGDGEIALGGVTLSLFAQPFMNRLTLLGSEASLEVNLNNMTLIRPNLNEASQLVVSTIENTVAFATGRQRFYPGIGAHLRELYAQVAAGGEPPVSAAEGRDVVAWYDLMLAPSRPPTAAALAS
jgi:hypothetical protein